MKGHWDYFEKSTSKSAPYLKFDRALHKTLAHNTAYDVIGSPVDWSRGFTQFYLGLRKEGLEKSQFLGELSHHVDLVSTKMKKLGLRGYIIIANEDYEVAYLNWTSKKAYEEAFRNPEGSAVNADIARILTTLMFKEAQKFNRSIAPGGFYSTLPVGGQKPQTENPRVYSERASKDFARGDSNSAAGWRGCEEDGDSATRELKVRCTGETTVLVFGGRRSQARFECLFRFTLNSADRRYTVQEEDCALR